MCLGVEAVANAANGVQIARRLGIVFDFRPKLLDEVVDGARRAFVAEAPGATEQLFTTEDALSVLDDVDPDLLVLCEELGLASVNRGPLGMGLLTGKLTRDSRFADDDQRHRAGWHPGFRDGRVTQDWLDKIAAVREVLTSDGRTLAQGALAWIWARSPVTVPIPGFRTVAQVEENAGAIAHGPLTAAQVAEVDRILGR